MLHQNDFVVTFDVLLIIRFIFNKTNVTYLSPYLKSELIHLNITVRFLMYTTLLI